MSHLLSKVTVTSCSFTSNVQCVRLAAVRRTQAGDAMTNGTINETLRHTLDISQDSVATHLRCGGTFSDNIIANFLMILTVK